MDLFDSFFRSAFETGAAPAQLAPLDVARVGDDFVVAVDLPGLDPESLDIVTEGQVLTVSGTRTHGFAPDAQVVRAERPRGRFTRRIRLPAVVDAAAVTARYDAGVLELLVPLAESAKPRRIPISGVDDRALDPAGSGTS